MIKKIGAILILCAMLITSFAACSKDEISDTEPVEEITPTTEPDAEPEANTSTLRIMSFNVHNSMPDDEAGANRAEAVKTEIMTYKPDLLGLQEDITAWTNTLVLDGYTPVYDPEVGGTHEHCAIYVKDGITVWDYGYKWLTSDGTKNTVALTVDAITDGKYALTADELAKLQISATSANNVLRDPRTSYIDAEGTMQTTGAFTYLTARGMSYVVVDVDGQKVIYANTHLQHRSPDAIYMTDALTKLRNYERLAQFEMVQAQIEELKKTYTDAVVVVTGDFNDVPDSSVYNAASAIYNDASKIADMTVGTRGTWNAYYKEAAHGDNYPNTSASASTVTLDYCFVTKDKVTVDQYRAGLGYAEITVGDQKKTLYTSDHRPIISDIRFETPGVADKPATPVTLTGYPKVEGGIGNGGGDEGGNEGGDETPVYTLVKLQNPTAPTGTLSTYSGTPDTSWFTGDKTEYTLTTADQLMGFAELCATNNFYGITIKLGANMVINTGTADEVKANASRHAWSINAFCGTFDGDGHYISGIYTTNGMFAKAYGALINFSLINSYVEATTADAGSVVGKRDADDLTIANVYVEATVKSSAGHVGGIIGSATTDAATNNTLTIKNCTFKGTVESTGGNATGVGGIIGFVGTNMNVTVEACKVDGTVKGAYRYVGGILGETLGNNEATYVTINSCAVTATVEGTRGIGGIAGFAYYLKEFKAESCSVNADITCTEKHAGGLFGRVGNVITVSAKDCFYKGKMTGDKEGTGGIVGWEQQTTTQTYENIVVVLDGTSTAKSVFGNLHNGGNTLPTYTNVWYDSTVYSKAEPTLFISEVTATADKVGGKTTAELKAADMVTLLGDKWSTVTDGYAAPTAILSGVGVDMA